MMLVIDKIEIIKMIAKIESGLRLITSRGEGNGSRVSCCSTCCRWLR